MSMAKRFGPVWVIAEQNDCEIETVSLQLIGRARELAEELGVSCEALLLGNHIEDGASKLIAAGADRVFLTDDPALELYQPMLYRDIICSLAEEHQPEIILIGSTCMGRELAPIVAATLKTGLAAHCTGLRLDKDLNLEQQIPAYGGLLSIVCPEKRPQMATITRGVFKVPEADLARKGAIVRTSVPPGADPPVRTLEVVREGSASIQLGDARIIVCGGAGACTPEGWPALKKLAEALDAAIGCTRPAVDEGWAPLDAMIGQSGKMVSPEIYIGVGLSGEQQHMVGIRGGKLMVAINNDPKSPVFEQVDIGIVENCQDFLPVLIAKIMAYKESRLNCQ
ncbi:MAG: electron transfer flavoprotein subunit alpha/FixB family protein [Syntrophobacteraceae bacterium]